MIDALFGSKTRVKLLHLFLNNPGKSFYVREITRLVDEQINSVRRELANMLSVGVITSDSADHKLYYTVDQGYQYYAPFHAIFADKIAAKAVVVKDEVSGWQLLAKQLPGARVSVAAGILVSGSASVVDLLLVGNVPKKKSEELIRLIEKSVGRELRYSILSYDEFYYRMSVRDKFISDILTNRHVVLVDTDNILKSQ